MAFDLKNAIPVKTNDGSKVETNTDFDLAQAKPVVEASYFNTASIDAATRPAPTTPWVFQPVAQPEPIPQADPEAVKAESGKLMPETLIGPGVGIPTEEQKADVGKTIDRAVDYIEGPGDFGATIDFLKEPGDPKTLSDIQKAWNSSMNYIERSGQEIGDILNTMGIPQDLRPFDMIRSDMRDVGDFIQNGIGIFNDTPEGNAKLRAMTALAGGGGPLTAYMAGVTIYDFFKGALASLEPSIRPNKDGTHFKPVSLETLMRDSALSATSGQYYRDHTQDDGSIQREWKSPNLAESLVNAFHISNPKVADFVAGIATAADFSAYVVGLNYVFGPEIANAISNAKNNAVVRLQNRYIETIERGIVNKFPNLNLSPEQLREGARQIFRDISSKEGWTYNEVLGMIEKYPGTLPEQQLLIPKDLSFTTIGIKGSDTFKVNTQNPFSLMTSIKDLQRVLGLRPWYNSTFYSDITGFGHLFNTSEFQLAKDILSGKNLKFGAETLAKVSAGLGVRFDMAQALGETKVRNEDGSLIPVYSGHSNINLYGEYDPNKSTAGGYYATEDPQVASNYAMSKMGVKETFERGSQYRIRGPQGKFNKKIWQIELTPEEISKIDELKNARDKYDNPINGIAEMDRWIEQNKHYEKNAARMFVTGGSHNLQNIYDFMEYMGNTIAYPSNETHRLPDGSILPDRTDYMRKRAKEDNIPEPINDETYNKYASEYSDLHSKSTPLAYVERQRKNDFEELMDYIGLDWDSYNWARPGVQKSYLNIRNPIDTSKPFPSDLLAALKEAAKYERAAPEYASDHWTKEYKLKSWIKDIESGSEYWATQIPKKALPIIKKFGYDGIKDTGGKGGGTKHGVWIAFDKAQIFPGFAKADLTQRQAAEYIASLDNPTYQNPIQVAIIKQSGIPEEGISGYVMDSSKNGSKLRRYAIQVQDGEISLEQAAKSVMEDYAKMEADKYIEEAKPKSLKLVREEYAKNNSVVIRERIRKDKRIEAHVDRAIKGSAAKNYLKKGDVVWIVSNESLKDGHISKNYVPKTEDVYVVPEDGTTIWQLYSERHNPRVAKTNGTLKWEIEGMTLKELERHMTKYYENNAPQEELNYLEKIYSIRKAKQDKLISSDKVEGLIAESLNEEAERAFATRKEKKYVTLNALFQEGKVDYNKLYMKIRGFITKRYSSAKVNQYVIDDAVQEAMVKALQSKFHTTYKGQPGKIDSWINTNIKYWSMSGMDIAGKGIIDKEGNVTESIQAKDKEIEGGFEVAAPENMQTLEMQMIREAVYRSKSPEAAAKKLTEDLRALGYKLRVSKEDVRKYWSKIKSEVHAAEKEQPMAGGMIHEAPAIIKKWFSQGETITGVGNTIRITDPEAQIKDISGNLIDLPKGHEFRPYILSNGKIWLHDGKNIVVDASQLKSMANKNLMLGRTPLANNPEVKLVAIEPVQDGAIDIKTFKEIMYIGTPRGENYRELYGVINDREVFEPSKVEIIRNRRSVTQGSVELKYDGISMGHWDDSGTIDTDWMRTEKDLMAQAERLWKRGDQYNNIKSVSKGYQTPTPHLTNNPYADVNRLFHLFVDDVYDTVTGRKGLRLLETQGDWYNDRKAFMKSSQDLVARPGGAYKPVPDHPLLKKWPEEALKAFIKEAVDGGYDFITWVSGQEVADRYDLSKDVGFVRYSKDGQLNVSDKNGGKIIDKYVSENEIEKYIGKEHAKRLLESNPDSKYGARSLSGEGLKVGGESKKQFYDKQIPNTIQELLHGAVEESVDRVVGQHQVGLKYVGKEYAIDDLMKVLDIAKKTGGEYVSPITGEYQHFAISRVSVAKATKDVIRAMTQEPKMTFNDAMAYLGNNELANIFGGSIEPVKEDQYNESIDLTPQVKEMVTTGGQPMAGGLPVKGQGDLFDMPPARTDEQIAKDEETKLKRRTIAQEKTRQKKIAESEQAVKDRFKGIIDGYKDLYDNAATEAMKNDYAMTSRVLTKAWNNYISKGLPVPPESQYILNQIPEYRVGWNVIAGVDTIRVYNFGMINSYGSEMSAGMVSTGNHIFIGGNPKKYYLQDQIAPSTGKGRLIGAAFDTLSDAIDGTERYFKAKYNYVWSDKPYVKAGEEPIIEEEVSDKAIAQSIVESLKKIPIIEATWDEWDKMHTKENIDKGIFYLTDKEGRKWDQVGAYGEEAVKGIMDGTLDYTNYIADEKMVLLEEPEKLRIVKVTRKEKKKTSVTYNLQQLYEPTQKELVKEAVKEQPKKAKQVSKETGILEPNVRRILGVGEKEGVFERVDKGVYVLKNKGQEIAYIHAGDSIKILPELAAGGFKADMIFLDIPYDTAAVKGGNRGVKYALISPEQFLVVVKAISQIAKSDDSVVFYMYSQATSGLKDMQKYNDIITKYFKPFARGEYTKLQMDGITQVRNMRGDIIKPEGIIALNKSGNKMVDSQNINFRLVRPKGYQTEKPAAMLKALIEMSTKEGETVLDPFAGSGVAIEQAVKTGRKGVAIEKNEAAIEQHIKPRVEAALAQTGGGGIINKPPVEPPEPPRLPDQPEEPEEPEKPITPEERKVIEDFVKKQERAKPQPKTIAGEILLRGRLNEALLAKDYNIEHLKQFGMGYLISKDGKLKIDEVAQELVSSRVISVPPDMNPADYLMELLKTAAGRKQRLVETDESGMSAEDRRKLKEEQRATDLIEREARKREKYEKKIKQAENAVEVQGLIEKIKALQAEKKLSNITVARVRRYIGIEDLKDSNIADIEKLYKWLDTQFQEGDSLMSEKQIAALKEILGTTYANLSPILPKRVIIEKFGEKSEIMNGSIVGKFANELFPTVDIKEGHPLVKKIVDNADILIEQANERVKEVDREIERLIKRAEASRRPLLSRGERVARALTPMNKEIFAALGGDTTVKLTPEENDAVIYLKRMFLNMKDALKLEKYRRNYVTHMEKPLTEKILTNGLYQTIKDLFQDRQSSIPDDLMLELENIIGSEKFFRYALQRKGGLDPTTNLRQILHDYYNLFETKMALDKILPEGQAVVQLLLQGKSKLWMKQYLQNLKGRGLDFRFMQGKMAWLGKVANGIIDIGYLRLLGLPGGAMSAVKNIVAGEANSFMWQDFETYIKGKKRAITEPKKLYKMAVDNGIFEGTYSEYARQGLGKIKYIQDKLLIGQKMGEIEIRSTIFAGELTDAEWNSEKISPERLVEIKNIISHTQGIFSKSQSPLFVQTWYGRMIMQMNRWRITNLMLVRKVANDAKAEWAAGKRNGPATQRAIKMFILYGLGLYVEAQMAKAGIENAAKAARSSAQAIDNLIETLTLEWIMKSIRDNPTLETIGDISYSIQELASFILPYMVDEPRSIEFNQGIEDMYVAPIEGAQAILDSLAT